MSIPLVNNNIYSHHLPQETSIANESSSHPQLSSSQLLKLPVVLPPQQQHYQWWNMNHNDNTTNNNNMRYDRLYYWNRFGQYIILGCGSWIYIYLLLGKIPYISQHVYQPIVSDLSKLLSVSSKNSMKAMTPFVTLVVPILLAGMMASIFHISHFGTENHHHPSTTTTKVVVPPVDTTTSAAGSSTTISSSSSTSSINHRPYHHHRYHQSQTTTTSGSWYRWWWSWSSSTLWRRRMIHGYYMWIRHHTNTMILILIYLPLLSYTIIGILLKIPAVITTTATTNSNSNSNSNSSSPWYTTNVVISDIANVFGIIALYGMSFLLIPVTKYSPILQYFTVTQHPLSTTIIQYIHQSFGYCILMGVLCHVGLHIIRWYNIQQYPFNMVLSMLFIIPSSCFTTTAWTDDNHTNNDQSAQFFCSLADTASTTPDDCTCYGRVRNVMGSTATMALLVITITSLVPIVRRRYYTIFYILHCIFGLILFLFVILHWNRSIIYVSGNMLYYLAGTLPIWMVQLQRQRQQQSYPMDHRRQSNGGNIRITSIERISCECHNNNNNDVIALTIETTKEAIEQYYHPGQYIKLYVPSISMVSHPFTINQVLTTTGTAATTTTDADSYGIATPTSITTSRPLHELRIMFRCVGQFTKQLSESISITAALSQPPPVMYVDGFYGPLSRTTQIVHGHDHVVFVAGGIGITPYLSLLYQILSNINNNNDTLLETITLYWICRDQRLIEYVCREYFDPIVELFHTNNNSSSKSHSKKLQLRINIHQTKHYQQGNGHDSTTSDTLMMGGTSRNISYTNLEQQQIIDEGDASLNEKKSTTILRPQQSTTILRPQQTFGGDDSFSDGLPFVPSKFFPGPHTTITSNVTSFVIYTLVTGIGLAIIWYFYSHHQTSDAVIPRLWAPIVIVVHGYIVTRGMYWLIMESSLSRHLGARSLHSRKDSNHECADDTTDDSNHVTYSSRWTPIRTTDNDDTYQEETIEGIAPWKNSIKSPSVEMGIVCNNGLESSHWCSTETDCLRATVHESDGQDNVDVGTGRQDVIEIHEGRPTVLQILNHFDNNCYHPGLHACGPSNMMRHICNAIKERNSHQCRCTPSSYITLYEESFEM